MPDAFHVFLSGGAGVGKSFLVKTVTEYLTRILKHHNQRLDQPSILVTASTGKAATNINHQFLLQLQLKKQLQILMAQPYILHFIYQSN